MTNGEGAFNAGLKPAQSLLHVVKFTGVKQVLSGLRGGRAPAIWISKFNKKIHVLSQLNLQCKWTQKKANVIVNSFVDPFEGGVLKRLTGFEQEIEEQPEVEESLTSSRLSSGLSPQQVRHASVKQPADQARCKQLRDNISSDDRERSATRRSTLAALPGKATRKILASVLQADSISRDLLNDTFSTGKKRARVRSPEALMKQNAVKLKEIITASKAPRMPLFSFLDLNKILYKHRLQFTHDAGQFKHDKKIDISILERLDRNASRGLLEHWLLPASTGGRKRQLDLEASSELHSQKLQNGQGYAAQNGRKTRTTLDVADMDIKKTDPYNTDVTLPDWKPSNAPTFLKVDKIAATQRTLPNVANLDQVETHQPAFEQKESRQVNDDLDTLASKMKMILEEEARRHGIGV